MKFIYMFLFLLVGSVTWGSANAQDAAVEKARLATHQFKEAYWNCLGAETQKVVPRKFSASDFIIYITAKCPAERQKFKVAFVDYLALRHPDVTIPMHFSAFEDVAKAAINDVASAYVDLTAR